MVKKEKSDMIEVAEIIEPSENIASDNEFDLSVLKSDIENAEKEAKEAIQKKLIEQADFQKDTENIQEEAETLESFEEILKEFLEFLFEFPNKYFEKKDISKLDTDFTNDFTDKLIAIIPKNQMEVVKKFIGAGSKAGAAKRLFRISRFIMFVSKELYKRYDEYTEWKKTHKTDKAKKPKLLENKK